MLEIHLEQRIVVRELEVTCPNERIRINADDLQSTQIFRLTQRTIDGRVFDLAQFVYPEGIYTCRSSGRIGTRSHVEFITLRQSLIHIHPAITIVHEIGLESTIGIVHRRQCIHYVLFLAVPRNFLTPVNTEVLLVEVFIFRLNSIIGQTGRHQVGERNGVTHPVDELAVLIVGNLGLIHPERINGYHHHIIRLLENSRLSVGTHHEGTLLDK